MAFQQEIFRRFASDTNARVLCANQKKTRDSSRSLGHARAFTDRVTSLHGRGGLSSPALSDSLHSTASSSGPFTTSSLDPGYACDRGSRLSDGSSTDFGGSPLLSPPASAPAASHSRPHCPIDASLRSPPVQPIAADALPPTAPAQSLAVSKGQKSQSEGLHPSVGQVDGLNRTMQGRVKDDGGATQNNRRAQDSEVDTVVTQPRAQSPLVGLRRDPGSSDISSGRIEPTVTTAQLVAGRDHKRRKLQHPCAPTCEPKGQIRALDRKANANGEPLLGRPHGMERNYYSKRQPSDASCGPTDGSVAHQGRPPEARLSKDPSNQMRNRAEIATADVPRSGGPSMPETTESSMKPQLPAIDEKPLAGNITKKAASQSAGLCENNAALGSQTGDSDTQHPKPLEDSSKDSLAAINGNEYRDPMAARNGQACHELSRVVGNIKGDRKFQNSDYNQELPLVGGAVGPNETVKPFTDREHFNDGKRLSIHGHKIPDQLVAANSKKVVPYDNKEQTQSRYPIINSYKTPQVRFATESHQQALSDGRHRPSSQDQSTSSLSSLNSDDLFPPDAASDRSRRKDNIVTWRQMIKTVLADAPTSGYTVAEITEGVKHLFPCYSHEPASRKLANIQPLCSQYFYKHQADLTSKTTRARWSLYPPDLAPTSSAGKQLPNMTPNRSPRPTDEAASDPRRLSDRTGARDATTSNRRPTRALKARVAAFAASVIDDSDSDRLLVTRNRLVKSAVRPEVPARQRPQQLPKRASGLEAWWDAQNDAPQRSMGGLSIEEYSFLTEATPPPLQSSAVAPTEDDRPRFASWQDLVAVNPQWGRITPPRPDAPYLMRHKKQYFGKKSSLRTPAFLGEPVQEVKDALGLPDNAALIVWHGRLAYRDLTKDTKGETVPSDAIRLVDRLEDPVVSSMSNHSTLDEFDERRHCIVRGRIRDVDRS